MLRVCTHSKDSDEIPERDRSRVRDKQTIARASEPLGATQEECENR